MILKSYAFITTLKQTYEISKIHITKKDLYPYQLQVQLQNQITS